MASFWRHVNRVLQEADLIIEVLDARQIEETRNIEIEQKIKKLKKKILYVITKCDLAVIDKVKRDTHKLRPSVFISSKAKLGTTILKKKILELAKGKPIVVGIVGYPNVGKSSLINALSGRGAAKTSSESGYTRGVQKIRVDSRIILLDTPGVFPQKEKDIAKHGKTGAIDYGKIKDPETAALHLVREYQELFELHYGITSDDEDDFLVKLAIKINRLQKGGNPDTEAAARFLLKEWQTGKINEVQREKYKFRRSEKTD